MHSLGIFRWLLLLAVSVAGCSQPDEITHYRVERVETPVVAKPKGPTGGGGPQQVLGAIYLRGDMAWFFKAFGAPAEVAAVEGDYQAFLQTVTFSDDGKPKWELPSGWKQLPGSQFRLATLRLGTQESAPEASVIGLPKTGDDEQKYLLDNVNRWRNQLQLPPWTAEQMKAELKTEKAGDAEYQYVSLTGTAESGGGMTPPFAGGNRPPRGDAPRVDSPPPSAPPASTDIKFELPEGRKEVTPASAITKAAFRAGEGEKLEITITVLGGPAGGLADNVNRWRGQIKLPRASDDELKATLKDVSVDGAEGKLVELVGEGDSAESILGAIVLKGNASWFVKAKGPVAVAAAEKARFEAFVQSLKLP